MMINAASLAAGTIITSLLGLGFWALAARLYTPEEVGLANAQLAAATLIAAAAALNMGGLLLRYLPRSGTYSRWIITRAYTVVGLLSIVIASGWVLLGLGDSFLPDAFAIFVFIVAVPLLAIFQEQDPALIGLGVAPVVTIENALFAIAKIMFLIAFIYIPVSSGIFAAWILPTFLTVGAITFYIYKRLLPRHMNAAVSVPLPPRAALYPQMLKLYASSLSAQILSLAIPLVIIGQLGATENGYLTIPWLLGVAFVSLVTAVTTSFAQDVRSGHPVTLASMHRLLLILGVLAGLGGLIVIIAAPLIMRIIAPDYVDYSTGVLRYIGLAAPLQATWLLFSTFLWLENRLGWMAAGNAAVAVIAVGVTAALAGSIGIEAAGLGSAVAGGALALVSVYPMWIRYRHIRAGKGADWTGVDSAPPVFR